MSPRLTFRPRTTYGCRRSSRKAWTQAYPRPSTSPTQPPGRTCETAYRLAWKLGCKGITVYRAGSREVEVLTSGVAGSGDAFDLAVDSRHDRRWQITRRPAGDLWPDPPMVQGITDRVRTGPRQYVRHRQLLKDGHPFRGVLQPGQGRGLRLGPAGGYIAPGLPGPAVWH